MKKGFRNERGITLATLAVYIISLLIALAVLALVTTYFRSNLNDMKDGALDIAEHDKFNSHFLEEVKRTGNEIKNPVYDSEIASINFTSGNRYIYEADDFAVYLVNDTGTTTIKVAEKVNSCVFIVTKENEKTVITVTMKIGNDEEPRETKYVMGVGSLSNYDYEGNYIKEVPLDAFGFVITLPSNDLTYTLNLPTGSYNGKQFEYNFEVDWGDGTKTKVVSQADINKTHTYSQTGDYTIKITGVAEGAINFNEDKKLKQLLTGFPKEMNVTRENFSYTFYDCTNLTGSIPAGLFVNTPNVTNFYCAFSGCIGLTGPSIDLWTRNNVTDGGACYQRCTGLSDYTTIPAGWK